MASLCYADPSQAYAPGQGLPSSLRSLPALASTNLPSFDDELLPRLQLGVELGEDLVRLVSSVGDILESLSSLICCSSIPTAT